MVSGSFSKKPFFVLINKGYYSPISNFFGLSSSLVPLNGLCCHKQPQSEGDINNHESSAVHIFFCVTCCL